MTLNKKEPKGDLKVYWYCAEQKKKKKNAEHSTQILLTV